MFQIDLKLEEKEVLISDIIKKSISNIEMIEKKKNINIKVNNHNNIKLICDIKWQIEAIPIF